MGDRSQNDYTSDRLGYAFLKRECPNGTFVFHLKIVHYTLLAYVRVAVCSVVNVVILF